MKMRVLNMYCIFSVNLRPGVVAVIVPVSRSISGTDYYPMILIMIVMGYSWTGSSSLPAVSVGKLLWTSDFPFKSMLHSVHSWSIQKVVLTQQRSSPVVVVDVLDFVMSQDCPSLDGGEKVCHLFLDRFQVFLFVFFE